MSQQFDTPAPPGSGIDWKSLFGALLIIDVHGTKSGIQTVHGPSDAVQATVTVVDGPTAGAVHTDTLVFPRVLQGQLGSKIGKRVLGRLTQGVAKPGQSAPWMLDGEATEGDMAAAGAVLAQLAGAGLQQAAPAVQQQAPQAAYVPPPQQAPVGQPVQQGYAPQPGPAPTY